MEVTLGIDEFLPLKCGEEKTREVCLATGSYRISVKRMLSGMYRFGLFKERETSPAFHSRFLETEEDLRREWDRFEIWARSLP